MQKSSLRNSKQTHEVVDVNIDVNKDFVSMEGPEHLDFILFALENQVIEIDTLYFLEISR